MLSHFPTALPDESLYSICARYYDRVRYPNKKAVPQELFGTINATAIVDLPTHIGKLISLFPPNSDLTADRIIDERTSLPFYAPFLKPEIAVRLREDMIGSKGSAIHMRAGIMAGRIPLPERLRFCPLCQTEDRKLFKQTYWHRLHQLPGVEVCPSHAVFLEQSKARARHLSNPFRFLMAEEYTETRPTRPLDPDEPEHMVLLKLASNAAWLLDQQRVLTSSLEGPRNRYLALLIERGLASYSGGIRSGRLLGAFREYYPPSLLKRLHCDFAGANQGKTNWLLRLVRTPDHSHHPLRHLLLINFLGVSAEQFFGLPEEIKFFGDQPWPCLNPAADHFREPVVTGCSISFRGPARRPVGTFRCSCGFAYARTGPDLNPEDRFRITKMKSFGPAWEQALARLWADPSLSVSGIAQRLEVDPITIRRHAERRGLSVNRSGRKSVKPLRSTTKLRDDTSSETPAQKRHEYRDIWLSAMEKNPTITMKSLRREMPRVYAWLLQNDAEWLKVHRPARPVRQQVSPSVDWGWRDAKLAFFIWSKAIELLNGPGKPAFLSKTAICKGIGISSLVRQKIQKLPLTAAALTDTAESRIEYATRRVRWAAHCFLREEIFPQRWCLILRANVYRWRSYPQVAEALNAAMEVLEQANSQVTAPSIG